MGKLQKIGLFINSAKGWWAAVTFIPTIWATISAMAHDLPAFVLILITMSVLAVSSAFGYYSIEGYDYLIKRIGKQKELNDVADKLQNLVDVGQESLALAEVAKIWAGDNADKNWDYNPKFKRIKAAVIEGKVGQVRAGSVNPPGRGTPIMLIDLIKIFREGDL